MSRVKPNQCFLKGEKLHIVVFKYPVLLLLTNYKSYNIKIVHQYSEIFPKAVFN